MGPQYHNENRFTKIRIVRFKRIYECILRSTSLTLIRKVCVATTLGMIVGTVSRAHFGVGFGVAFWAATVSEAMIYYLN